MEEKSKKIINLFKSSSLVRSDSSDEKIKYFAGFNYVRLDRDSNGNYFVEEILDEYASKQRYIVTVMREKNSHVSLYKYEVESSRIIEFISKFYNNVLDGKIVEIEKFQPEDLA